MRNVLFIVLLFSHYCQAALELSGIIDMNYEVARQGGDTVDRLSGGGLSTNRLELKGYQQVTDDLWLEAVYQATYTPNTDDPIGRREVYAQVISKRWGTLSAGRQDTPSAHSYGYADPLYGNDYSVINNMSVFYAPWRVDRSLMYISPRLEGYQLRIMGTQGERDGSRNGQVYSISLDYWSDSPWYFAAAVDRKYQTNLWNNTVMEQSTDAYFTTVYSLDETDFTLMYHHYSGYYAYRPWVDFSSHGSDLQLGVRHHLIGKHHIAASVVYKDDRKQQELSDAVGFNLGYLYRYSKQLDFYGVYGYIHHQQDSAIRYPVSWNLDTPKSDENPHGVQMGVRYKF